MKKLLFLLGVLFLTLSVSASASELVVPFYYTAPNAFQQPPVTYNGNTYNNLFVESPGNGYHSVSYINFESWYPRFACMNEPCDSGNASFMTYSSGRLSSSCNDSTGECTTPYHSDSAGISWPFSRIGFLSAPIYKNDFATVYREADVPAFQLFVSPNPVAGGGIASLPDGTNLDCNAEGSIRCGVCGYNYCHGNFDANSDVTLKAFPNDGWTFAYFDDGNAQYFNNPSTFTMSSAKAVTTVFVYEATDFVYPVLASGQSDPLQNKTDPIGNGWSGPGVGEHSADDGHLGQDYVINSGDSAGKPVYAVAKGTIVTITNNPDTQYGWCNSGDHGWGPVVVIRHDKLSGFCTASSIVTSTCSTETSPTFAYSLYGHLKNSDSTFQSLHVGDTVTMGQQVGVIGDHYATPSEQPWSTNHLHFELKEQVGFSEGAWYSNESNHGVCPESTAQACSVSGVGTGYSYSSGFAPHRYSP